MSRGTSTAPWSLPVSLAELHRGPRPLKLAADGATRDRIARALDLPALHLFEAEGELSPWLDGGELNARWRAEVTYTCGVTLEPYESSLEGEVLVRAVPPDSPQAVQAPSEVELDLDSEDPPDVLDDHVIDVGAYLVEHLALELDPFPRKPDAVFAPPPAEDPESPFAVLKRLNPSNDRDDPS